MFQAEQIHAQKPRSETEHVQVAEALCLEDRGVEAVLSCKMRHVEGRKFSSTILEFLTRSEN